MKLQKLKKYLINLGLILVSILAAALLLEVILRFTPYRHLFDRDMRLRHYYQVDPVKGFDIRPNAGKIRTSVDNKSVEFDVWSNELGCFDEPYRGENDLILLVGDSFTHAFAPYEDKWGTRVEKLLNYRVLKCGVTAYGTKQELLKAREIIARINRNPRLIIVGHFLNDLDDDFWFTNMTVADGFLVPSYKYRDPKTGRIANLEALARDYTLWDKLTGNYPLNIGELIIYSLNRHLILFNLIRDSWVRLFPSQFSYTDPLNFMAFSDTPQVQAAWAKHQENLKAFKELAAAQGAELLIVLIPANIQVYPFFTGSRKIDLERPQRILGDFFRREGIRCLDLLPWFRKYADQSPRRHLSSQKDLYWRANSHWSIKGERLASLLVARAILENNLVKVAGREEKLKYIEEELANFPLKK